MKPLKARSILPQPIYPIAYTGLKWLFPQCLWDVATTSFEVVLSFDDGPHPDYTPQLLEVLDQFKIKATFFPLGERVERWPQLIQSLVDQDHQVGLHGYQHRSFPSLSPLELFQSLKQTQTALAKASGHPPDRFFYVRPPNGLFFPQTLDLLRTWQFQPVMWTVVPEDWVHPPIETVIQRILHQVRPGAIIVLHDGVFGGCQVAETVKRLIPLLQAQGWIFRTL